MKQRDEKEKGCLPFLKNKFKEIFLEKNKNMEIIADKLLELNAKENSENDKDKQTNEEYMIDVINIVKKFIDFIEEKNFYTVESFKKLCEFFIFSDVIRKNRNSLLNKIYQFKRDVFDKNKFLEYFFNRLNEFLDTINSENPERYKLLDSTLTNNVFNLYQDLNDPEEETENSNNDLNYFSNIKKNYQKKMNPLKYKYFDILWKMYLKLDNFSEVKKFLEDFSLKNFSPEERYEIWKELVKKIFDGIDNNIYLSLQMLDFIITNSEKYGSGGAKSHLIDSKRKIQVKFNFKNDMCKSLPEINFSDEEEKFYSTDTVYDIKKKIQKKYGIDPIFMDIGAKRGYSRYSNWKSMVQIFPRIEKEEAKNEEFDLILERSKIFDTCPKYPFKNDNIITPKYVQFIREILNRFAKDGKLYYDNYKKFYINFFHNSVTIESQEKECKESFNKADTEKKGYLTLPDFMSDFENKKYSKNLSFNLGLYNLGYIGTLDYYLSPLNKESPLFYQENNVKEYMPRYFIGNNKEYMRKLFNFAKYENKNILEAAQNLIQEVCTLEELKKMLFENNKKIAEAISYPNLELRGYVFDILLTEFEKEEKEKKFPILVNDFVAINLIRLIIELGKFSDIDENNKEKNENNSENKDHKIIRYFNFYLTNLKIIFHSFKYILKNNEVANYIDKFDDLEDENQKNVFGNRKIDLNFVMKELVQHLQLNHLVNIIGKNSIIINEKSNQSFKSINISVKLLIYIILFSKCLPEKEKEEIYKNYTNYEILLTQTSSFSLKSSFYKANKLLLNFMNDEIDKKFISIKYDLFSNEILNYNKLNELEGKLSIFFKIFIDLFDISIKGTQNDKIFSLYENLVKLILDKNVELKEYLLTGYLNIIREILSLLKEEKNNKLSEYDFEPLIQKIINEFIITFDTDETGKINEINNLKNYSRYSETDYVSYIFQILTIIISINPLKYLKIFFLNEDIQNLRSKHLTKLEDSITGYHPYIYSRSSNSHIGLKNLSSICYMNSVLQQFFMMPLFRYAILSLPIPKDLEEEKEDNDNLMFQLIRMFYYLNFSDKGDYNPKNFVYSFKDYDGNPTKINIQCDAQEFLSRFIEKIEECLKNNSQKFLCTNILGGSTLQQVKCTNPDCGNISERKENINFLSLDIKNVNNVEECLDKFILEEKIEDYHCEKCDKKITNIKRVLIDKIPNILIIHLQRIAFSYETFNMEKINSYITFEKYLNIKKYTVDKDNKDIPLEYFDYNLQGIIIHSGTAQYGHYYSFTYDDLKEKEKNLDPKKDKWFKFNDSTVSKVDYDNISIDAFGSNNEHQYGSSAYMLIYQKDVKKPVIINSKEIEENKKKFLEEENKETIENEKGKIEYIYENEKEAIEKNTDVNKLESDENLINKDIIIKNCAVEANLISYQEALNKLIKENNEEKEKKPFFKNILLENIKICNDKKFYTKAFNRFIKEETELIRREILYTFQEHKIDDYLPVLKVINDYIFFIIPFSNFIDEADMIVEDMSDILSFSVPKEFISSIIKDIIEPKKEIFYSEYFCSHDNKKGKMISTYIGKILSCSMNNNIEIELTTKIIQFYLDKIPIEITKKWLDMEAFNNLILTLVENSDVIKKSFINNGIISKLIDLIMGKDSPLYQGDDRIENKNNKPKFGNIVKAIALLYKYYAENFTKEELKLSKSDLIMIDCNKFYEKAVVDDYDSDASNMLIDYKMNLIMILDKEKNKEEFDKEIIDIIIKLKIPSIKKKEEIISGINLITHIIEKYAEIYNIKDNNEEIDEKNKQIFIEKLNILLGVPIPVINGGEIEMKYISGRYQDKYTILSNIYSQKEKNKEALDLLKSLFNLFNTNKIVFDYLNKLPSPNSFKYSFIDYCIKLYTLVLKDLESESKTMDELEMENPYKKFEKLVNEICLKNKKDIKNIENNDKICFDNLMYLSNLTVKSIENLQLPKNVFAFKVKIDYFNGKNLDKTYLLNYTNINNFSKLEEKQYRNEEYKLKIEYDINSTICVVIVCKDDLDISINFKPYFISKMEIETKKDCQNYIYSASIDDEIKDDNKKVFNLLEFKNIKIEAKERKLLALPQGGISHAAADDGCAMNCPVCGNVNILNDNNPEFKCVFCESPLF